jgi:hypothetical protein
MRSEHVFLNSFCLVGFLFAAGCNSKPTTYSVTGAVRFEDGQPVPYGAIEFRNEQSGISARGKLDANGAFELGTYATDDGAPAGTYRVIVVQFFNPPPAITDRVRMRDEHSSHDPDADVRVSSEVSDSSTTLLRAEVTPDGTNQFEFIVPRYVPPRGSRRFPARSSG